MDILRVLIGAVGVVVLAITALFCMASPSTFDGVSFLIMTSSVVLIAQAIPVLLQPDPYRLSGSRYRKVR